MIISLVSAAVGAVVDYMLTNSTKFGLGYCLLAHYA